jgi:O-antigen/teichoic acid export membrane protein
MLRYIIRHTGSLTVILAVAQLSLFFSNVVIARGFGKMELGLFTFVNSGTMIAAALAGRGYANSFARHLSSHDINRYRWRSYLAAIRPLNVTLALAAAAAIFLLSGNNFDMATLLIMWISASALIEIIIRSRGIIRPNGRFNAAMTLERGWRVLFLGIVIILALLAHRMELTSSANILAAGYCLSLVIFALCAWFLSSAWFAGGELDLPKTLARDAKVFWAMAAAPIAIVNLDKLLIARLLSLETLGLYGAIFSLMGAFPLVSFALGYVLLPHFARLPLIHLRGYLAVICSTAAALLAFYWILGEQLVKLFYGTGYMPDVPLIAIFSVAGSFQLFDSVASALIAGVLESRYLRLQAAVNTALAISFPVLLVAFINAWGVAGAAWAMAATFGAKALGGYWIVLTARESHAEVKW